MFYSPRHKHWPAGPAHFSDRRTSSGQYILSVTGPYGPPRYISGHQISNSAGPNDDNSVCIFRAVARPTSRQFSRSPFATARRQRVTSPSLACQSNTLTSVFRSRGTSTRSGTHPGTFLREAHVMVPSKQFCVLVGYSEILIDKSAGSMQGIVVTHLTVMILSVIRVIVRLRQWK